MATFTLGMIRVWPHSKSLIYTHKCNDGVRLSHPAKIQIMEMKFPANVLLSVTQQCLSSPRRMQMTKGSCRNGSRPSLSQAGWWFWHLAAPWAPYDEWQAVVYALAPDLGFPSPMSLANVDGSEMQGRHTQPSSNTKSWHTSWGQF